MSGIAKSIGKPNDQGAYPVNLQTDGIVKDISNLINQLENCDTHITPVCLEALYKFSVRRVSRIALLDSAIILTLSNSQPLTQVSSKKNSYGIVEYTPQSYIPSDLDLFAKNFTPKAVGYRPTFDSIDGGVLVAGTPNFDTNGESNLDLT